MPTLEELILPLKTEDNAFRANLSRVINLVQSAVSLFDSAIKATFKWADEIDSLQDIMGVSARTAAAYNYVLRKSGTNTEQFAQAATILGKNLVDANGKLDATGKSLKKRGINVLDANGSLKDQDVIIAEVAQKYGELGTQTERLNFLTETFGKSGGQLIDFFDTLAQEGGIDAVSQKIKDMGLAIDPDRYEQFNRSLEEMKLVGLSVAVAFTERLMPIFEDLVKWIIGEGIPGFLDFKKGLEEAFDLGGFAGAFEFLDTSIAQAIESVDWAGFGATFGDMIEGALTNGAGEIDVPQSLSAFGTAVQEFFTSAIGQENINAFKEHFVDYILLQLNNLNAQAVPKVKALMDGFWAEHSRGLQVLTVLWNGWSMRTLEIFRSWGIELHASAVKALSQLQESIAAKLAAIAENFQRRAHSWLQKATEIFNDGKGMLVAAVAGLVSDINAQLKKIITSFTISIKTVFGGSTMGSTGTASLGTSGGGFSQVSNAGTIGGRASGGPVIGGQSYTVLELGKSETYTPQKSGRIDPAQEQKIILDLDYERLGRILATEVINALNNN